MGRAPCCDKANVKRGPWSPDEDDTLKSHIQTHGTGGNWIALPHKIGLKRCGKSCRLRWLNYLRPNIKHGGFTEDEDNLICRLFLSIGSRWSIIAAQLPGRTDNDIKNYWNTRLRKKLLGRQRREQTSVVGSQNHTPIIINECRPNNFMSPYPHAATPQPFMPSADNNNISFNSPNLAVEPITFPCYDDINNDQNLNCYASTNNCAQLLISDHQMLHQQFSSNYVPAFDHDHPLPPQQEHELLMDSVAMMDRWPGDCRVFLDLYIRMWRGE